MTLTQFRQTAPYVDRMRQILNDEVMQAALMTLHDSNLPKEPPPGSDALASVRLNSHAVGFNDAIAKLLSLADPVRPPAAEEEADYGVTLEPSERTP